ncbi:MAG: 30S ribosomal protein S7 [Candidatus Freyarchaeum deiterrae]
MSEIKVFGKWITDDVEVHDVGLRGSINLTPKYVPHTDGRHEHRRFMKARVFIVERLINKLQNPGRNAGKKMKALNIVRLTFEIINIKTGENPLQVLVNAVENAAPREETTRISYGGIVYHQAVDVSPLRRVDLALRFITNAARKASFGTQKTIEECLADELISAANNETKSSAVMRKEEKERIATSVR